ncbi:MmpS family transport accessory protein [Mycobacterium sp. NPDC003449]
MVLVAVAVIALSSFTVYRLHGIFASRDVISTPTGIMDNAEPFDPKRVLIEVFGPPGTVATISYLDVDAQPQRVDDVALPWSYDASTTKPAIAVNVAAKGDSDSIGCRITIDNEVKDERTVNTVHAFTHCLDKSG